MKNFSLMILAAGYGKRMKHLTKEVPKPLLKINDRELLSYNIDFFLNLGCNKIVINTHYLHNEIKIFVEKNGKLAAKASGKAKITVSLNAVQATANVVVSLAEVIEFTDESVTEMRLSDKPGKVVVVVKDRNGNVLEGRNLKLTTSDYCVKVRQSGTVFPASLGRCDVIATVDGATNAHTITVKE